MKQPSLFDAPEPGRVPEPPDPPDQAARRLAVDPANNVVLEASAGTGKTRVLTDRYARLIEQDVDPANILAITFTRKAAAEMRERVLTELRKRAVQGTIRAEIWQALKDRIADIQISTIDAFCFTLLREFPLEAGVDPGFEIADETEMARFAGEAMELALRAARSLLPDDESLRLLFTRVKLPVLSRGVSELLDRRHVALPAVRDFVRRRAAEATAAGAASAFVDGLRTLLAASPHRHALLEQGPHAAAEFRWLQKDLSTLDEFSVPADLPRLQHLRRRAERYFLTSGKPRKMTAPKYKADFRNRADKSAHDRAVAELAPAIHEELQKLKTRTNAVLARGLYRLLAIAVDKYEMLLEEHALLDFAGMLERSVRLLERQEEFARSRLKLQGRYHHVLVDEFQDTSRMQWRLIELLIDAWGEGESVTGKPTSIFVVGDRKQSIYRFRHAEVTLLDEAARKIQALRESGTVRQAITTSYRAVPELLAFVNALAESVQSGAQIPERFEYTDRDRFPAPAVSPGALRDGEPVLGIIAQTSIAACAAAVAAEVRRLIGQAIVRPKDGEPRAARPDDVAILFRSRAGHQFFEAALEAQGIRTYVYKGLGFFDAPEVQDLQALMRFLAQPDSDLRAAEFLRSRFVRLSDPGLVRLAGRFADALTGVDAPEQIQALDAGDRSLLDLARGGVGRWLAQADRVAPSELVDLVLRESAYMFELRGRRLDQARENIKKVRGLVRRVENRGYATLGRIAEYFETLRAGDESNAILEAAGAVNLMTIHSAKGLEFPIVFVVNMHLKSGGRGGSFTVVERGEDELPDVAFSTTPSTQLEEARDREELRRMLYVAATRARDRLYLAAETDPTGQIRRRPGSLASLLPDSLLALFGRALLAPDDSGRVTWDTPHGTFAFRVCPVLDALATQPDETEFDARDLDVNWLVPVKRAPVPAAAATASLTDAAEPESDDPVISPPARGAHPASDRLIGTIVHRLFQRQINLNPSLDAGEIAGHARGLVRPEERVDVSDLAALATAAAEVYGRLRARADLRALLQSGRAYYEVPFSYAPNGRSGETIRGVIDCLVIRASGPPLVLEFKTGRSRPDHAVQVEQYAAAAREILSIDRVETRILYA